jgi:hypothetical protein
MLTFSNTRYTFPQAPAPSSLVIMYFDCTSSGKFLFSSEASTYTYTVKLKLQKDTVNITNYISMESNCTTKKELVQC